MIFFAVGFAMLLHVLFWGAGLATLATPNRWRRFWLAFVPLCGFGLQAAVVWLGCYLNLRGTNQYAWPAEIIPAILLVAALRRRGVRTWCGDWARFGLAWAITGGLLVLLLLPLAIASHGLTSVSLGSCDAADYAAGARVFMEFARTDRTGFLGLTDVVRVMSVDNFVDFWLRLNHFTPSALIALNGSILHCAPHELTNIVTAVALALTVPLVFWIARALFGYTAIACLVIASVYGISPVAWYSFGQVSPAPLLVAQAIAVLNWAGVVLWNARLSRREAISFAPLLVVAFSVVLGAYNFILLVALVPTAAYAIVQAFAHGKLAKFAGWCVALGAPLLLTAVLFWARTAGLVERFLLFQTYDFGWKIPALGPEGWFGLVQGGTLRPWPFLLRWPIAVVCVAALSWAFLETRRRRRRVWLLASIVVPILAGYAFLEIRGIVRHTNASYDAFKLFAVFYPLLLPAFCWWITLRWSTQLVRWLAVAALTFFIVLGNVVACAMSIWAIANAPLLVDGELRQLRRVEADPSISSINVLIPDMWSRLWANNFLLRKPQYFETHTYEGRLNTPLRGEWNLTTSTLDVVTPTTRILTPRYRLLRATDPSYLRLSPGTGWYGEEHDRSADSWRWIEPNAQIVIENPHSKPITARVTLDGRAITERELALTRMLDHPENFVTIGEQRNAYPLGEISIPPGASTWVVRTRHAADRADGDSRALSVSVFSLRFEPLK